MYFQYTVKETDYLSQKDKRLGEAIQRIGPIRREVDTDWFPSVVPSRKCTTTPRRKP